MKVFEVIKAQQWPFWLLFVLLIAESIFALRFHILVCNLPLADTLLLIVSLFRHQHNAKETAAPLFQRICGCVSFCAILFVNASHALEMMTESIDTSDDNHTHAHGDQKGHDDEEMNLFYSCIVPYAFVPVIFADALFKSILLCANRLPSFSLHWALQILLHLITPLAVFALYGIGWHMEKADFVILSYLDPIATFAVCIISAALIVPAFLEMKPFVFADTPQFFDMDKFTTEISTQFDGVQCTHIHVYRIWPKQNFEALIHLNIEVDKSEANWGELAAARYSEISEFIRSDMKKDGAEKIVIEPRFVDRSIDASEWQGCVGAACYVEDRGCCSMVETVALTEA